MLENEELIELNKKRHTTAELAGQKHGAAKTLVNAAKQLIGSSAKPDSRVDAALHGKRRKQIKQHKPNHRRAQGLVEFALALPIFLLIALGIIEFGWMFFVRAAAFSASREATRYGIAAGISENGVEYYKDCTGIQNAAIRIGAAVGVDAGSVDIRYDTGPDDTRAWADLPTCPNDVNFGDRISVRVAITYNPIMQFLPIPSIPMEVTTQRTVITKVELFSTMEPTP